MFTLIAAGVVGFVLGLIVNRLGPKKSAKPLIDEKKSDLEKTPAEVKEEEKKS